MGGWQHVLLLCLHATLSHVFSCSVSPLWSGKSQGGGPRRQDRVGDLLVPLADLVGKISPWSQGCWRALQSFKQNKKQKQFSVVDTATPLSLCTLIFCLALLVHRSFLLVSFCFVTPFWQVYYWGCVQLLSITLN